jgi:hypothetical protein
VKFPERNEMDIFGKLNVSDGTGKVMMMERWAFFHLSAAKNF